MLDTKKDAGYRLVTSAVLETDPQRIREWIQQNLQELGAYSTLGFVGITLLKSIGLLVLSNKVIFTDPRYCRLYFTAESTLFFSKGLWSNLKSSTKALNVCTHLNRG